MADPRPWAKIDAAYFHNPKWFQIERVLHASMPELMANGMANDMASAISGAMRVAREAHLASILYSAQHQTDGLFPIRAIKAMCMVTNDLEEAAITALFEVGMWIDHPGGMAEVHDYLEHQTPASLVKKRSEAGKKGAAARWGTDGKNGKPQPSANGKTMTQANAEKKRKEEKRKDIGGASGEATPKQKRGTRVTPDWMPSQKTIDTLQAEYPNLDYRAEHADFIDYWLAKPGQAALKLDWDATWRRWMRKAGKEQAEKATTGYRSQAQIMAAERERASQQTRAMQGNALNLIEGTQQ